MGEVRSELSSYKSAITSLFESVHGVDVRAYESMLPEQLAAELRPIASALLSTANALVLDVLRTYEAEAARTWPPPDTDTPCLSDPYVPFEKAIDAAIGSQNASSLRAVGDIAFLAHLELRQRAERLDRVGAARSASSIIGECDSALRRIVKALTSIDLALARAGLVEPTLTFASELEVSLRVRAACGKLRRRILANGDPSPETLHARLRGAGTAIAMLVGWDVYPLLRVRDRLELRELQRRILDWLRGEREAKAGMHLWQDLVAFMRLLSQINQRQELVDHDRRVTEQIRARIANCADADLDEPTLTALRPLAGLDDDIDELLEARNAHTDAWQTVLDRLAPRFGRATS